jgi:hypothetical protein
VEALDVAEGRVTAEVVVQDHEDRLLALLSLC